MTEAAMTHLPELCCNKAKCALRFYLQTNHNILKPFFYVYCLPNQKQKRFLCKILSKHQLLLRTFNFPALSFSISRSSSNVFNYIFSNFGLNVFKTALLCIWGYLKILKMDLFYFGSRQHCFIKLKLNCDLLISWHEVLSEWLPEDPRPISQAQFVMHSCGVVKWFSPSINQHSYYWAQNCQGVE